MDPNMGMMNNNTDAMRSQRTTAATLSNADAAKPEEPKPEELIRRLEARVQQLENEKAQLMEANGSFVATIRVLARVLPP